jgi:hypothetical protein
MNEGHLKKIRQWQPRAAPAPLPNNQSRCLRRARSSRINMASNLIVPARPEDAKLSQCCPNPVTAAATQSLPQRLTRPQVNPTDQADRIEC